MMNSNNADVKREIQRMAVTMYEVAAKMQMSPSWLTKHLNKELTEEQKRDVLFYARAARHDKWGD